MFQKGQPIFWISASKNDEKDIYNPKKGEASSGKHNTKMFLYLYVYIYKSVSIKALLLSE
jgi:hypothetical protein